MKKSYITYKIFLEFVKRKSKRNFYSSRKLVQKQHKESKGRLEVTKRPLENP